MLYSKFIKVTIVILLLAIDILIGKRRGAKPKIRYRYTVLVYCTGILYWYTGILDKRI
jgi:prepilin signal peptidase PulO-like enzyme (type II secretory pathway)